MSKAEQLKVKDSQALKSPYVQAFLYMLAMSEGTEQRHSYKTMVGGKKINDLSKHPNTVVRLSKTLASSAAGRYQFLYKTWLRCQRDLNLPDFSAASQDLAAVYLIDLRRGLVPLLKGDVKTAIFNCRKEWASLPGAGYGQGEHSLSKQLAWFNSALKNSNTDFNVSGQLNTSITTTSDSTFPVWFAIGGILGVTLLAVVLHK
jgi:muramidase (phage lysozyme)